MEIGKERQQSVYEILSDGLDIYLDMYEKGLKKQANKYISNFVNEFEHSVSEDDLDKVLCRFCREICDEDKHSRLLNRGNGSLPHALGRIVWKYLESQCRLEMMPHMRWAFQLFEKCYNPFDSKLELDMVEVLEKAYNHKDCDQKTVDLYFNEILEQLYYGSHHFPDGCIITREAYEKAIKTAEMILADKQVPQKLVETYLYYHKLYQCFYEYEESGREKDFYELCENAGIKYKSIPVYYYNS
ncbi:MAG: hypothetical protein NC429_16685 [Lachnospiraceae bacterium]|nr:hypothetical protein [Lachnospiraceae bacterium]